MRFLRRCRHRCCPFLSWGGLGSAAASPSHRPDRPVSSDSFLVSPQDEGTEAEPGAGRASPTRAGHLTSPLPFSSPWGPLLAVLTGRGLSGGGGAPCRQLSRHFCASPSWVSTPHPSEVLNSLSHPCLLLFPPGRAPFSVPGSRRPTPHIPASSAVTSGALPAPSPQLPPCLCPPRPLPDLPYLFVRRVSECICLGPTSAFATRAPLVFQG